MACRSSRHQRHIHRESLFCKLTSYMHCNIVNPAYMLRYVKRSYLTVYAHKFKYISAAPEFFKSDIFRFRYAACRSLAVKQAQACFCCIGVSRALCFYSCSAAFHKNNQRLFFIFIFRIKSKVFGVKSGS